MSESSSASASSVTTATPAAARSWLRQLPARWLCHFWLKSLGTPLFMTVFFVAYFATLRSPRSAPTEMPFTALDEWIGFQPIALLPYASLWLYVMLPSSLMMRFRELIAHTVGAAVLSISGLALFTVWPTTTPAVDIDWAAHPQMQFLKGIDASGNACPSLHVAFAIFAACWLARLLRRMGAGAIARSLNILWSAIIVYSTLATRQHVIIDTLAGALLGGLVTVINLRLCPDTPDDVADPRSHPLTGRRPLIVIFLIKLFALALWPVGLPSMWACLLFFVPDLWVLYHVFVPGASGIVRTYTRFITDRPEVWLTIDDGPDEQDTPRILDLLDQHEARATFFLIGKRSARHPALVAEIARRGHEIGHHTHTHRSYTFWCATLKQVGNELDAAFTALTPPNGPPPRRFRAPVGIKNLFLSHALAQRNLTCIDWNLRSLDSVSPSSEQIAARVLGRIRPGAVLLMHEGPWLHDEVRVTAMSRVLDGLRARGLRCVIPTDDQLR